VDYHELKATLERQ